MVRIRRWRNGMVESACIHQGDASLVDVDSSNSICVVDSDYEYYLCQSSMRRYVIDASSLCYDLDVAVASETDGRPVVRVSSFSHSDPLWSIRVWMCEWYVKSRPYVQQISSSTLDARRRESPIGEDRCERARMGNGRGGDGGVDESIIRIRIVRVDVRSRTTSAQEDTRWNRLSRFLSRSCPEFS